MAAQATARARVQLGIHMNVGGHFSAVCGELPDFAPDEPESVSSWAFEGWAIESIHGNLERGGQLRLRQGALVNQAQALLGLKRKGKRFRVVASDLFGGVEPAQSKWLSDWESAGWRLSDITGNLDHGAFATLVKGTDDDGAGT